jgi:hypothetical protein
MGDMMGQIVTCPCGCNHSFEVGESFERYEKIVADLVGGKTAPPRTKGYDVVGQDGRTTYQVKYTKKASNHGGVGKNIPEFRWRFGNGNKLLADFLVLFAGTQQHEVMFLIEKETCNRKLRKSQDDYWVISAAGYKSWIWNYHVSSENFMERVAELKSIQQLSIQFTKGLGDA